MSKPPPKNKSLSDRLLIPKSGGGKISVALAHPAPYSIGMSSLGYQVVYRIINDTPGAWVERVFGDSHKNGKPRTVESDRHIADFDVIAFSLSFELDAVNMLRMLRDGGVHLESRKRHDNDPIIIAGGIVPTLNPEPYADFIDLFVVGEAEETLPELIKSLIESRGTSRTKTLSQAASIAGVYAPRFYNVEYGNEIEIKKRETNRDGIFPTILRSRIKDIDNYPAHSVFFAPDSDFGDMGLVEMTRGCARGCRFCAAGHVMRPPRKRSLKSLEYDFKFISKHFDCVGLISSSATDHPDIEKIIELAKETGVAVSFASLPTEGLTEKIIEAVAERSKTLTIAPETGTDRLRRVVNKDVSDDNIIEIAQIAASKGIKRVKMYFLVGLPTETADDVAAISGLVKSVSDAARKMKKNIEIAASIAPFVPKPQTPFEFQPMEREKIIEARISEIGAAVRKIPGAIIRAESPTDALFQGLLSRGDRRVGKIIRLALEENSIRRAMRNPPTWASETLFAQREISRPFPWDFIDSGLKPAYLLEEYHQGLLGKISPLCKPTKCKRCDVCNG